MAGDKEPSTKEMVGTTDDHSLTKKLNHERQEWEEKRRGGNLARKDKGKEKESSHQPINPNQVPPPVACAQTGKLNKL